MGLEVAVVVRALKEASLVCIRKVPLFGRRTFANGVVRLEDGDNTQASLTGNRLEKQRHCNESVSNSIKE